VSVATGLIVDVINERIVVIVGDVIPEIAEDSQ